MKGLGGKVRTHVSVMWNKVCLEWGLAECASVEGRILNKSNLMQAQWATFCVCCMIMPQEFAKHPAVDGLRLKILTCTAEIIACDGPHFYGFVVWLSWGNCTFLDAYRSGSIHSWFKGTYCKSLWGNASAQCKRIYLKHWLLTFVLYKYQWICKNQRGQKVCYSTFAYTCKICIVYY